MLLLLFGIYFTCKSGFFHPRALRLTASRIVGSLRVKAGSEISPLGAVATALGGTVGIGSIVGMGHAVAIGGAGSIFWMWVCSFFGMGLKYAEVKIALNKRVKTKNGTLGGAPFRLSRLGYKKTAVAFCLLCIGVSFFTGNLTQTGVIYSFCNGVNVSPRVSALLCTALVSAALFGGKKRIANINAVIVPLFSAVYLLCAVCILILNLNRLGAAFQMIFKQAFGFSAVSGGFSGALLAHTLREGFARSLFSNEAGMGSSPLAHASGAQPELAGAHWGIFEIFFDSFIVSTLTALCLLSANTTEVSVMFSQSFGRLGIYLFGVIGIVFAFASVISWCFYGQCCIACLFPTGNSASKIYRVAFALITPLGALLSGEAVWAIADILNALMMLPNLFLLFKCRKEIERMV